MRTSSDLWRSYFYDDAPDVLRNKLGIKDKATLKREESRLSESREKQLKDVPLPGRYDFEHLLRFHRKLFHDTYEWAGQPRLINQFDEKHEPYTSVKQLETAAADIERYIEQNRFFRGLDKEQFVEAFAVLHVRIEKLHPFLVGNFRAEKAFLRQLARNAGYDLNFKISSVRLQRNPAAEINHLDQEYFRIAAVPLRFTELETWPARKAVMEYPELFSAAKALDAAKVTSRAEYLAERDRIKEELLAGRIPRNELVTPEESREIIGMAASYRAMSSVYDIPSNDTQARMGEVVAVSAHHVLVGTQDGKALCYKHDELARQVFSGEYAEIQPRGTGEAKHPVEIISRPAESLKPRRIKDSVKFPASIRVDDFYRRMLRQQYLTAKYAQGQRIEERLEKQVDEHFRILQEMQADPPRPGALPSARRAWEITVDACGNRQSTLEERLDSVRAILGEKEKIRELAEMKMRRENRNLAVRVRPRWIREEKHTVTLSNGRSEKGLKPLSVESDGDLPTDIPAGNLYKNMLVQYVMAKYVQGQRIEERLEKQYENQSQALRKVESSPPKFYALPSTRKAWEKTVEAHSERLKTVRERLETLRETMGNASKIKAFAETKMRRGNRELARRYDLTESKKRAWQPDTVLPKQMRARPRGHGR